MDVKLPDGTVVTNVPDGTTQAQLMSRLGRSKFNMGAFVDTVKDAPRYLRDAVKSIGTGVMDNVVGAGQLVSHMGPQSFTDRYSEAMNSREAGIQADRGTEAGKFDPGRIAGNVIPALAMGGSNLPSTLGGRMLLGGKVGGVSSLVSPVDPNNENYATTKGVLTAGGAAVGALAVPAVEGLVKGVSSTVNFLHGQAKGLLTRGTTSSSVESSLKIELERNGINWSQLGKEYRDELVSTVQDSLKSGGKLDPAAMQRLADFQKIGVKPTQGQITRDPYQFGQEQNLAKMEVGQPIAQRLTEQNSGFMQALERTRGRLGAQGNDAYQTGQSTIKSLAKKDMPRKEAVDSAYKAFRDSVGQEADVPLQGIAQRYGQLVEDMGESNIPGEIAKRLNEFGLNGGKQTRVFNVREAEKLKTLIGNQPVARGSPQELAMTALRKSVDDAIFGLSDTAGAEAAALAQQARGAASSRFGQMDKSPAYSNVVNKAEDTIAPEKFVEKFYIRGEIQDVANNLRNMVPQNRAEVRAGVLDWIKGQSINGFGDAAKFSQNGLNKALNTIGDRKLDLIFAGDRQALDALRSLARASSAAQSVPVASGVNYSGSGTAILDAMDKMARLPILGAIAGKPGDIIRASQVASAIGPVAPTQPVAPLLNPNNVNAFGKKLGLLAAPSARFAAGGLLGVSQ